MNPRFGRRGRAATCGAIVAALLLALAPAGPARAEDGGPEDPHRHDATARHPFDEVDKWVRIFDDPGRDEWQKPQQVVRALGIEKGQSVAEIGAGTGYFSRHLAQAVGEEGKVYAIDTEPKMVEYMKGRAERDRTPQVLPVLGAPDDPRLPEAGADLVLLVDTYHHIDDRVRYLQRLAGRLRRGGRVAVIDFEKRPLPVGPPLEHKLERGQVREEFAEAGYALVEEPGFLPYQYFLIFVPDSGQGAPAGA